jgi:hypothetical protein
VNYSGRFFHKHIPAFLLIVATWQASAYAQESPAYRKNMISFDLVKDAINELNFNYEHRGSIKNGIEFSVGLIYVNKILEDFSKSWTNSNYFSEHGFSARVHYKIYKRGADGSKWRDYIAPGISYKYLYYYYQWFENEKSDGTFERIFQTRYRNKFGIDFNWGKVYEMNSTFAFEFYYGAGITVTTVNRTDLLVQPDDRKDAIYYANFNQKSLYFRPSIMGGIKLRIGF